MIAMLATIVMAAAPAPTTAAPVATASAASTLLLGPQRRLTLQNSSVCKAAGRLQTAYEPALLFRDQDRSAGRMRRLIDLPEATACLLGGSGPGEGK